jgi:hypothetical protein
MRPSELHNIAETGEDNRVTCTDPVRRFTRLASPTSVMYLSADGVMVRAWMITLVARRVNGSLSVGEIRR